MAFNLLDAFVEIRSKGTKKLDKDLVGIDKRLGKLEKSSNLVSTALKGAFVGIGTIVG